jgi:hypothetical protein
MALEQVGYDGPEGSVQRGQHREVITCGTATVLTASDSGAYCLFDTAAGSLFTLPTPVVGMYFDFGYTVKTTGEYKLITKTIASEFLKGFLGSRTTTAIAGTDGFVGNGTSHVSVSMDGGATGGDAGGWMRVVATSTTIWQITGDNYCGTTVGTDPFDTT